MAIAVTALDDNENINNLSEYTTDSFTPAADSLLVVWVVSRGNSRTATVSGHSLTWTMEMDAAWDANGSRIGVYTAQVGGSPSAGALTITMAGGSVSQCHWSVIQVTGHRTADPIGQAPAPSTGTSGTTFATTLASPVSADSRTIACGAGNVFQATNPGTNMTELCDDAGNSPATSFSTAWSASAFETNPSFTVASAVTQWVCGAVEVVEASAGGGGSAFTPGVMKVWDGDSWETGVLKVWDGDSWVEGSLGVFEGA